MNRKLCTSFIRIALISLAAASHAADKNWDYKRQPGAACQPQIGAQTGDFERYPHYILNISDTNRTVICPVVRDSVSETDLDIGANVSSADEKTREGGVRCSFYSMNSFGDTIGAPHEPSAIVSEGPDREIQYFAVKAALTKFDGTYAIQCVLQPGGQVYSYIAGELAETTDDD